MFGRVVRRGPRGRVARAQRDGGVDGRERRPAVVADGAAQGRLRRRLRVLHQPGLAQGRGAHRRAAVCAAVPWHPLERQVRVEGGAAELPRRRVGGLREPATRLPPRRPRLPPVAGGRLARRARRGVRRAERAVPGRGAGPGRVGRLPSAARGRGVLARPARPDARPPVYRREASSVSGGAPSAWPGSVTPMARLERDSALRGGRPPAEATSGHGRLALVAREAGVGRRRTSRPSLVRRAALVQVAQGGCDGSSTPAPLGPRRETLRDLLGHARPQGADRHEAFTRLSEALREGDPPDPLALEDAHGPTTRRSTCSRYLAWWVHWGHALAVSRPQREEVTGTDRYASFSATRRTPGWAHRPWFAVGTGRAGARGGARRVGDRPGRALSRDGGILPRHGKCWRR